MGRNLVGWYEIPVIDMDRAKTCYETIFDIDIDVQNFGGLLMGFFPFEEGGEGASGSLVQHESYIPSESHGALIYFSSEDVDVELSRVEAAGGTILRPKTQISPDVGFMGLFKDSEGNRVALHSRQ